MDGALFEFKNPDEVAPSLDFWLGDLCAGDRVLVGPEGDDCSGDSGIFFGD